MRTCSEITIYKVAKANIPRVIALSLSIIAEMNENETVITSHEILQSTDNEEEICWRLTWISEEAVQKYTEKWPHLPSANALMSLVEKKVYYGHFVSLS
jgi:nitric oxide reductase large subunit